MNNSQSLTLAAKTEFAQISDGKTLAFRKFGKGSPIIFANRFRGTLDTWDPAFLDAVAASHQVIIFQSSGTGSSKGIQGTTHKEMAQDIIDLANYLKIDKFALAGWSLGGFVAQVAMTEFPERITHGILIGTGVPGTVFSPIKPVFFERAMKDTNDIKDEKILFFNPKYPESIEAARLSHDRIAKRTEDRVEHMAKTEWMNLLQVKGFREDEYHTFEKMQAVKFPILSIIGEDDICFPAEDWFAMKGRLPNVRMLFLPKSGHGPQHQYPEFSARSIIDLIAEVKR